MIVLIAPATMPSVRPDGATKTAVGGGSPMLCERVATGRVARK